MRTTALIAGILLWAGLPEPVVGHVTVSLNNPGSITEHGVVVRPGDMLTVDVNVEPHIEMVWLYFKLAANTSDVLSLSGGTFNSPFDTALVPAGPLAPKSQLLGAAVTTFDAQQASSPFGSLTLAVNDAAGPGLYSLNAVDIFGKDSWITLVLPFEGVAGPDFDIQVVPEPGTLLLALASAGAMARRRTWHPPVISGFTGMCTCRQRHDS